METDALDYALTAILFIVNKENEVYPVAFHSCTFTMAELNLATLLERSGLSLQCYYRL